MDSKDPKKAIAMMILEKAGKLPKKPVMGSDEEEGESPEEQASEDEGGEAAAEDLLSALESKDPKAVWEAFKSLKDLC